MQLRSRPRLALGAALVLAGAMALLFAFAGAPEPLRPAALATETPAATPEPAGGSQSLGVAGGILLVAGIAVALLAFSDLGRPSRR
jgi:hypothetical protein